MQRTRLSLMHWKLSRSRGFQIFGIASMSVIFVFIGVIRVLRWCHALYRTAIRIGDREALDDPDGPRLNRIVGSSP